MKIVIYILASTFIATGYAKDPFYFDLMTNRFFGDKKDESQIYYFSGHCGKYGKEDGCTYNKITIRCGSKGIADSRIAYISEFSFLGEWPTIKVINLDIKNKSAIFKFDDSRSESITCSLNLGNPYKDNVNGNFNCNGIDLETKQPISYKAIEKSSTIKDLCNGSDLIVNGRNDF